jgi:hypothetical protein
MAKTAPATRPIERGMVRAGSRASSARFETVSIPVYAIIATGIERKKSLHVGATPQWMLSASVDGLRTRMKPIRTSSSCVLKSMTARKMFSRADSWIPTMFRRTRTATTIAPPMMSQGFSLSGPQKIDR